MARAHKRENVIASITLELDGGGFINRFSTSARARFAIGGVVSVRQDASYDHLEPVDESVWSAFNREQKAGP